MLQNGAETPYEVYCYNCNVSAPVDTKRCVHCGGRLSKNQYQPPALLSSPFEDDEAVELPRRGITSAMSVVWILLFALGIFYRICG